MINIRGKIRLSLFKKLQSLFPSTQSYIVSTSPTLNINQKDKCYIWIRNSSQYRDYLDRQFGIYNIDTFVVTRSLEKLKSVLNTLYTSVDKIMVNQFSYEITIRDSLIREGIAEYNGVEYWQGIYPLVISGNISDYLGYSELISSYSIYDVVSSELSAGFEVVDNG